MANKAADAFRTISEVSDWLGVSPHVLRFWESKFTQVKPVKRAGGRRYYRPADMELLGGIRKLLHEDGLSVKGVQKVLKEQGARSVAAMSPALDDPGQGASEVQSVSETTGQKDAASLPLFSARLTALTDTPAEPDPADEDAEAPGETHAAGVTSPDIAEAHTAEAPSQSADKIAGADVAAAGIAEAHPPAEPEQTSPPLPAPKAATDPQAPPSPYVIAPLPDLPSERAAPEAAPAPEPAPIAEPDRPAPVIAPLPERNLSVAEHLRRLQPGHIPADQLQPLYARLIALRARMDTR